MNSNQREEFYRRLEAENPNPTTELNYTTPFELLVAVVLSAQSTDRGVNQATGRLFPVANTPLQLLELGEEKLRETIRTLGLYRNKARHLIALSAQLIELHAGEVPNSRESLEALPGVGRKTANVILNTLFREPVIAVDTHIYRVANRTGLAPGRDVAAVERELLAVTPPAYLLNAHHWLILHGRYTCTARSPNCDRCRVIDLCDEHRGQKP
jgi:endonuclease-3